MNIVEVDPGKELRLRLHPLDRLGDNLVAGLPVRTRRKPIGIPIESPCQSGLPLEDHRRDEGARREPAALEALAQERHVCRQRGRDVVADAVLRRIAAREERDVGRPRERNMGVRLRRPRPVLRQGVDVGGRDVRGAVDPEAIRPKRVDGYDQDVLQNGRRRCGGRLRAAAQRQRDAETKGPCRH
jgi:hypothetical protein